MCPVHKSYGVKKTILVSHRIFLMFFTYLIWIYGVHSCFRGSHRKIYEF